MANVQHLNGVFYTAQPDSNLVKYKTYKNHHALHASYTVAGNEQDSMEFQLNLGQEYVNCENSYLKFTFKYSTTNGPVPVPASLSTGYIDLFDNILITDRHGITLERTENLHHIANVLATTKYTTDALESTDIFTHSEVLSDQDIHVVIPLHFLACGLFNSDNLLPPHLLDGAHIRLGLRAPNLTLSNSVQGGLDADMKEQYTYTISDPLIVCQSYIFDNRLHDLVTQEYESEQGLHIQLKSYTSIQQTVPSTQFTRDIQIRQPFSRATKIIALTEVRYGNYRDAYVDNVRPHLGNWHYKSIQAKIGDTYYPNTTLEQPHEAWNLWLNAFNKQKTGVSQNAREHFHTGNRVLIDTSRGIRGQESGVTISNRFPCVLRLTLLSQPEVQVGWKEDNMTDIPPRIMILFVEHERIIVAQKNSTRIVI